MSDEPRQDGAPSGQPDEPAAFFQTRIPRRTIVGGSVGAVGLFLMDRLLGGGALAASDSRSRALRPAGQAALPADAAPAEQQVLIYPSDITTAKVLDFYEQVYERPLVADLFSEPLARLDKNFKLLPAAAEKWEGSADGKTWTFTLDPNLVWSDGNPVTADDWVATFRYAADPKHAWDFTWFFQGVIKGWNDAIAGKLPLDQIGVRAGGDPHTLIFETEKPAPYLPAMLLYSLPLSKAGLTKTGPLYNTNPATAISSGPFILKEWTKDQQIVYVRNPNYKGKLTVSITKVIAKLADQKTWFTMFDNNEIDYHEKPAPAELKLMQADPDKAKQIHSGVGDFRTFYLFFDVTKAPFDNLKVRQAISHAVDRDAIQKQILGPAGKPAYSWLAPGFPAANGDGLKEIQKFDPAMAKQLLAEAGFKDGKDFPKQELWLRDANQLDQTVAGAVASMLKQNLGIEVEVSNKDFKLFMDSLNAKPTKILFGYVSYGMDYLDPSNMLGVWHSGGRHSWKNDDFDKKLDDATVFLGDPTQRVKMFQDAEKVLVSDVPGVFIYHETPIQLIKPWVVGDYIAPDENGIASLHWPGFTTMDTVPGSLYISKDVPSGRS